MIPQTPRARWRRRRALVAIAAVIVVAAVTICVLEPASIPFLVWAVVSGVAGCVVILCLLDPNPIPPREDPRARPDTE